MAEISRYSIGSGLFATRFAENLLRLPDGQYAFYSRGRIRLIGSKQDVLEADFLLCTLTNFYRINLLALVAILLPATGLSGFLYGSLAIPLSVVFSCILFFFIVTRRNVEKVLFSDLTKGTDLQIAGTSTLQKKLSCIRRLQNSRMRILLFFGAMVILAIGFDLYDKSTGISWDRRDDTSPFPLATAWLLFAIGLHGYYGRFLCRSAARDFEILHGVPLTRENYLVHELHIDSLDPAVAEIKADRVDLNRAVEQETRLKRFSELIPLLSPIDGVCYRLSAGRQDFALTADEIAGLTTGWTELQPDKVFQRTLLFAAIAAGGSLMLLATNFRSEELLLIYAGILAAVAAGPVIVSIIGRMNFLSRLRKAVCRLYPGRELNGNPVGEKYPPSAINPVWSFLFLPLAFGVPVLLLVCFDLWFCYVHGSCAADFAAQQARYFRPVDYRYMDVVWGGLRFDIFMSAVAIAGLSAGVILCFLRYLGISSIRKRFDESFGTPLTTNSYLYRKLRFPLSYRDIAEWESPGESRKEI